MPLRYLLKPEELVQDLELTADERLLEGLELLLHEHPGAGIYLLGYAAEMILKHAYFRLRGASPSHEVGALLTPARRFVEACHPGLPHEGYHSIWFWAVAIDEARVRMGRPLPGHLRAPFLSAGARLHGNWTVEMRYQPDVASEADARAVYDDVTWLSDHRSLLWR